MNQPEDRQDEDLNSAEVPDELDMEMLKVLAQAARLMHGASASEDEGDEEQLKRQFRARLQERIDSLSRSVEDRPPPTPLNELPGRRPLYRPTPPTGRRSAPWAADRPGKA